MPRHHRGIQHRNTFSIRFSVWFLQLSEWLTFSCSLIGSQGARHIQQNSCRQWAPVKIEVSYAFTREYGRVGETQHVTWSERLFFPTFQPQLLGHCLVIGSSKLVIVGSSSSRGLVRIFFGFRNCCMLSYSSRSYTLRSNFDMRPGTRSSGFCGRVDVTVCNDCLLPTPSSSKGFLIDLLNILRVHLKGDIVDCKNLRYRRKIEQCRMDSRIGRDTQTWTDIWAEWLWEKMMNLSDLYIYEKGIQILLDLWRTWLYLVICGRIWLKWNKTRTERVTTIKKTKNERNQK